MSAPHYFKHPARAMLSKLKLVSIAVHTLGNTTVDTGEVLINTKEQKIQIIILIMKRGPCLTEIQPRMQIG